MLYPWFVPVVLAWCCGLQTRNQFGSGAHATTCFACAGRGWTCECVHVCMCVCMRACACVLAYWMLCIFIFVAYPVCFPFSIYLLALSSFFAFFHFSVVACRTWRCQNQRDDRWLQNQHDDGLAQVIDVYCKQQGVERKSLCFLFHRQRISDVSLVYLRFLFCTFFSFVERVCVHVCVWVHVHVCVCVCPRVSVCMYLTGLRIEQTNKWGPLFWLKRENMLTWLIHMCDRTHSQMWCESSTVVAKRIHVREDRYVWNGLFEGHDSFTYVKWLVHTCEMTHSQDMTHSHVWNDSFAGHDSFACVTWLIHRTWLIRMCDMTHSQDMTRSHVRRDLFAGHDSFTCVAGLIHMCYMTHSHVWKRIHKRAEQYV